jgi:hypothetical protein
MQEILEITEDLGHALQKKSRDIVNAMCLVFSTKVRFDDMRSDDGWEAFFSELLSFVQTIPLKFRIWRKLIFYAVVVLVANLIVSLRSIIFE